MSRKFIVFSIFALVFLFPAAKASAQQVASFLRKGEKALQSGNVQAAQGFYEAALALDPLHLETLIQLGQLYLGQKQTAPAVTCFRKARQLASNQERELPFLLAEAYQLNYNFDSALTHYQQALRLTRKKDYDQQELIQKRLKECRSGLTLLQKPAVVTVRNVGAPVNSPFADHVPVLADMGSTLIFTSRRETAARPTGKGKAKEPNEDIYFSRREGDEWGIPQPFAAPLNSAAHEAALAVSADGQELYLYKDQKGGGLFVSRRTPSNDWAEPIALGAPFNTPDYEPSLALSEDGQYAFFSSDREGGFGGLDLYISFRQADGSWSEALNLGPAINSPFDEDAPFIDSRNNVLYFSSRGHNSMGGYDIFRSSIEGSLWSQAENLGLPFNSPFDDIYFVLALNGKHGYYASDRPGGLGEKDIYLATFTALREPAPDSVEVAPEPVVAQKEPELPNRLLSAPSPAAPAPARPGPETKQHLLALKGKVLDEKTGVSLPATITLFGQEGHEIVTRLKADSLDASFTLQLEPGRVYKLVAQYEGYFFYKREISIPADRQTVMVLRPLALKKLAPGKSAVLENILFAFNQKEFAPGFEIELDLLYQLLAANSSLRIEVSGHTDNRGSVEANRRVSQQRATAVVNYLLGRGIDPKRMRAVGYGFSRPVASNATEEGRRRNRRTEFTVSSNSPEAVAGANKQN